VNTREPVQPDDPARFDLGRPGASARAEYERRRRRDDVRRQQRFGRHLAPLITSIWGPTRSTAAWGRGGDGEELVGAFLSRAVGDVGLVLHDRAIVGTRSNIDHIAVVPSGVWVIDTKQYRGRVQRRDRGGWFVPRPALVVNGHDRTSLVAAMRRQRQLVQEAVGAGAHVHAALCFTGAERGTFARPFTIDDVVVTWPRALARLLVAGGARDLQDSEALAARIAEAFPPYAPSGTSHKPIGAPPRG
jgi:hypothetical protein